jgi:hypothetical protein
MTILSCVKVIFQSWLDDPTLFGQFRPLDIYLTVCVTVNSSDSFMAVCVTIAVWTALWVAVCAAVTVWTASWQSVPIHQFHCWTATCLAV